MMAIIGVRALLPPGYMLSQQATASNLSNLQIVICTHSGPEQMTLDLGIPDGEQPTRESGDAPCLYALSSIVAPPPAISSVLPTHLIWVERKMISQVQEFRLSFEFGPAVGSRAPPFFG